MRMHKHIHIRIHIYIPIYIYMCPCWYLIFLIELWPSVYYHSSIAWFTEVTYSSLFAKIPSNLGWLSTHTCLCPVHKADCTFRPKVESIYVYFYLTTFGLIEIKHRESISAIPSAESLGTIDLCQINTQSYVTVQKSIYLDKGCVWEIYGDPSNLQLCVMSQHFSH